MLKQARKQIIENLWQTYHDTTPHIRQVEAALQQKQIHQFPLDHLAIIDLPGPNSGIPTLREVFKSIGYTVKGRGYLPDKQNDFTWLAECDSEDHLAADVLPQVVVADFRPEEMPTNVRVIIEHYATQSNPAPLDQIRLLAQQTDMGNKQAAQQLTDMVCDYLSGRDWPLPTIAEFNTVRKFNELMAWVLVFGRRPNHFTVSVHLLSQFSGLPEFHHFIESDAKLTLNSEGGIIKGDETTGIAQGSTLGITQQIDLADGCIDLPTGFVEFVWRYPQTTQANPERWTDFFTGFVAQHANHVIESLYSE